MKESLIQAIWQYALWDIVPNVTTNGFPITILQRGILNTNEGPDFLDSLIEIDKLKWAGNVEIHTKSSAWKAHKHTGDLKYDNVILHVVWEHDGYEAERSNGTIIPTLELKSFVKYSVLENFELLYSNLDEIACSKLNPSKQEINLKSALHRSLADRMLQKAAHLTQLVKEFNGDWQEAFYIFTVRYFGLNVNRDSMEQLAKKTPQSLIAKHRNNLFDIEALLFGQAGLLQFKATNSYSLELKQTYSFLAKKYNLQSMSAMEWKFNRMRPANFPTIRISQIAMLMQQNFELFSKLMEEKNVKKLYNYFDVHASEYWDTHYTFDKQTDKKSTKHFGKSSIEKVLINVVAPALFAYGKHRNEDDKISRAFDLLELLPNESNQILEKYEKLGFENSCAYDSQAILGLYHSFCTPKKCTECSIGIGILKN